MRAIDVVGGHSAVEQPFNPRLPDVSTTTTKPVAIEIENGTLTSTTRGELDLVSRSELRQDKWMHKLLQPVEVPLDPGRRSVPAPPDLPGIHHDA